MECIMFTALQSLWLKNFIDLDSGDDDDVQEVYHELPKKKSRKEIGSEMTVVQSDDAEVRKSASADDYCPPDDVDDVSHDVFSSWL